jgi:hypothetical protein
MHVVKNASGSIELHPQYPIEIDFILKCFGEQPMVLRKKIEKSTGLPYLVGQPLQGDN